MADGGVGFTATRQDGRTARVRLTVPAAGSAGPLTVWDNDEPITGDSLTHLGVLTGGGPVLFTPWTDGFSVGYHAATAAGGGSLIYLTPSTGSDDGTPTVFVYDDEVEGDDRGAQFGNPVTYLAPFGFAADITCTPA